MPSPEELAYIAGLFDGEGHVTITKNRSRDREQFFAGCGLSNQNIAVLEWIKSLFGGHVYCVNVASPKHPRACYQWTAHSIQMETFLEAVLPCLRIKRRQAEIGIAFQRRRVNTKPFGHKVRVSPEEIAQREILRIELRALNRQRVLNQASAV